MNAKDILADSFGRLPGLVRAAVRNLSPEQLCWAPAETHPFTATWMLPSVPFLKPTGIDRPDASSR